MMSQIGSRNKSSVQSSSILFCGLSLEHKNNKVQCISCLQLQANRTLVSQAHCGRRLSGYSSSEPKHSSVTDCGPFNLQYCKGLRLSICQS